MLKRKLSDLWKIAGVKPKVDEDKKVVDVKLTPEMQAYLDAKRAAVPRGSLKSGPVRFASSSTKKARSK